MIGPENQICVALEKLQDEKKYFSIAVYRIEGENAVRMASAGATCEGKVEGSCPVHMDRM